MQNLTGPITVFNKTIFDIMERQPNPPAYLHFIGWVYLWSAIFHWITALLNCMPHLSFGNLSLKGFRVQLPEIRYAFLL